MISHRLLDPNLEPQRMREIVKYSARQAGVWERALAFYLLAIRRRRLYELWGYASFEHYVEEDVRLDERKARDCLALARALDNVPRLERAFADGEISWTILCYLARVATPETVEEWLAAVRGKTTREVRALVRKLRRGDRPQDPHRMKPRLVTFEIDLPGVAYTKLKSALARMETRAGKKLTAARRVEALADLVLSLSPDAEAAGRKDGSPRLAIVYHSCPSCSNAWIESDEGRIGIPAEVVEEAERGGVLRIPAPEDPGEDAVVLFGERGEVPEEERDPTVPLWKRMLIFAREGYRCAICGRSHDLMCHHLKSRGKGGTSDFRNLLTVCRACHEAIHSGLLIVRIRDGGRVEALDAEGHRIRSDGDPAKAIAEDPIFAMTAAVPIAFPEASCDEKPEHAERSELFGLEGRVCGAEATPPEAGSAPGRRPLPRLAEIPDRISAAELRRLLPLLDWDASRKGFVLEPERACAEDLEGAPGEAPQPPPSPAADRPEDPRRFADLVGQRDAIEWLAICARAARRTGGAMDHVLLSGPAGLGKTTIARVLANELGVGFTETCATAVRTPAHFLGILAALRPREILFLDEVHGLDPACQDFLLSGLDRGRISLAISEGARTRAVTVVVEPFTLIAATTDPARLTKALRSRFPIQRDLVAYGLDEIATIIERAAGRAGDRIAPQAVRVLAGRARGNAREALRFLRAARILAQASGASEISPEVALRALEHLGIDEDGLRPEERRLLAFLAAEDRPVGLRTIADALDLDERTVREVHEPALLREGWIRRTRWGRRPTAKALAWARRVAPEAVTRPAIFPMPAVAATDSVRTG